MVGKIGVTLLTLLLAIGLCFQFAMAGPDWKAHQAKLFGEIGLKPGDVIDKSNWQKAEKILPPSVINWVKKGEFVIKIGQMEYDYAPDAAWMKASKANTGKFALGPGKEVVVAKTGEPPVYYYGEPFPNIDITNPDAGIMIMHNITAQDHRTSNYRHSFNIDWVGEKGWEREMSAAWIKYFYLSRYDGEKDNPKKYQHLEIILTTAPYDVAGTVTLTYRMLDGRPDIIHAYIPSIRRVKKLSGANRSDPFLGTDYVNDDGNGWSGQNTTFKWKVLKEQTILIPVPDSHTKKPLQYVKLPDGTWRSPPGVQPVISGWQVKGWKGAPWAPMNVLYVPRTCYVIEGTPLDPYYNYGKQIFYVDKGGRISYKVIYDKAGEYWKTLVVTWQCAQWGDDNKRVLANVFYYAQIDDKSHHASIANCLGVHRGKEYRSAYEVRSLTPRMFTPANIQTLTK